MSDPTSAPPLRVLLLGDSGAGKSGALASLAKAGYRLWIADFDNGLEILRNLLRGDQAALARVDFETCRDSFKLIGSIAVPTDAKAWAKGIKYLEEAFKQASGPDDIVVIDSLSFAAKAAMLYTLKINNRLAARPFEGDWGDAQRLTESLLGMITADSIKCHILCTAHISYQGNEATGEPLKGLPAMIGKALNPVVGRYFNHQLLARQVGSGAVLRRAIHTTTFANIELKNTSPGSIKPEYPLATGLADYFADARGTAPKGKTQ